jgi:hypothetical protein
MIAWVVRMFASWRQTENAKAAQQAFDAADHRMARAEYWAGVAARWRD